MIARVHVTMDWMFKRVVDLKTGEMIPRCIAANDTLGTFLCHATDEVGKIKVNWNKTDTVKIAKRGRIRIVDVRGGGGGSNLYRDKADENRSVPHAQN